MDPVLLIFLPKALAEIVGKYYLPPSIKSSGISFEDEESQRNGITLLCRYEIDSLAGCTMKKEWITHPSCIEEWVTIQRGAECTLKHDSPLTYMVGMDPHMGVIDGEIIILCHIQDPMMSTLRPTPDGKYVSYSSCGICDYDSYSLQSSGYMGERSHDKNYCLTRRKRASRKNIEARKLDLNIHGRQEGNRFSRRKFTFRLVDYKFSNQKGEIERMKKEWENLSLRNLSPITQGEFEMYMNHS